MNAPADRPFAGRRVLAIVAHPDDESLACGGTLARCADAGAEVRVLSVTRGGAGQGQRDRRRPLGEIRRQELDDAAAALGIATPILLDHPDGDLRAVRPERLRDDILDAIRHDRPDVVITFGADGLYWHPDHIVVHEQVTGAVTRVGTRPPALFYVTMPAGMMRRVLNAAAAAPGAPAELSFWGLDPDAFGAHAEPPTLAVDVRASAARKLAAIRCHRTQIDRHSPFAWLTEQQATDLVGVEHFHRAAVGFQGRTFFEDLMSPSAPA